MFPISSIGVVWMVPIAEYGWEDDPAAAAGVANPSAAVPVGSPATATLDATAPIDPQPENAATPCGRRLVITGYRYEPSVQWIPFDSPLAMPWQKSRDDDDSKHILEPRPELKPER